MTTLRCTHQTTAFPGRDALAPPGSVGQVSNRQAELKTWATMVKADVEPISGPRCFGHEQWRKDWVKVSCKLTQDRRAWSASARDVVNAIGVAGSTRLG